MNIYLLRHTRPRVNTGICYGQSDVDVAPTFKEELELIQHKLSYISFDAVFSSPLKRCMRLAHSICKEQREVFVDSRLKEMNFGLWEMHSWEEIATMKYADVWFNDYINRKCPQGESFIDVCERVRDFIRMLQEQTQYKSPLIVTHAGVIRAFVSVVQGLERHKTFDIHIDFGALKSLEL